MAVFHQNFTRHLLAVAIFLCVFPPWHVTAQVQSASATLTAAVRTGISRFQEQCRLQQTLMPELIEAVRVQDLSRARTAYTAARPPYEQIETLANAFPKLDADIDARPYAIPLGEDNPEFRGFHVLERAFYRDQRLGSMFSVVITLNNSINDLCVALNDASLFNPRVTFKGAVALAFEIPAKKLASEEETWSDLSLMIFRNNYRGIWSQVSPFLSTAAVSSAASLRLRSAYARVQQVYAAVDPQHSFFTTAGNARPYSDVTRHERRRISRAAYNFVAALEVVRDQVFDVLPKELSSEDEEDGSDSDDSRSGSYELQVRQGLSRYLALCRRQKMLARRLLNALQIGDLNLAKHRYKAARPPYEQIEVLAADFVLLDQYIDQRPYVPERGELDSNWRGFHEIERKLYRDRDVLGALPAMRVLNDDITSLCDVLEDGVVGGGSFSALRHFDGMITLAYEVPAKKISSEEEEWSDLSVLIFRENAKGIWTLFEPFKNVLPRSAFVDVEEAYLAIKTLITYVVDEGNHFESGLNFTKYSQVSTWERQSISETFYNLGQALRRAKDTL